ncbi:c-type cytochrome [Limnoglobus roseus]|uniref:Cytochrome c n=1 Tax=Limnoglobus roseus TaxID=2598579 RepID=A0A5C1AGL6_9BACT|nr:cytochrome c [Limnoglobus roseus]QEL18569.1 cytochrome c [Limnoglobus roseus]
MDAVLYPTNDFGPLMKGLVIGGLGIFHVFTAHFAIGGGILLTYFQWLSMTGRCRCARAFVDGYFRYLVLISFVAGALTGVGMWFTTIQVSPVTIGLMVDEFHWLWAIEWTFFSLEVVAGYAAFRYGSRLTDRARLTLLALYSVAAWMSLFWINGILSFQLTPGAWLESRSLAAAFFNPTFLPSLLYRTIAALVVAALSAMVVVNLASELTRPEREELVRRAAWLMAPMAAMPLLGLWFVGAMPPDSREWIMGGSIAMTLMLNIAVGASALVGGYALVGLLRNRLYVNGATATVLCVLAFAATAGGEFVREGVRKPYTLRELLYSNAVRPEQVAELRRTGLTAIDPFPLRGEADLPTLAGRPHPHLRTGALVFREQCSVCHTVAGVNALPGLTKGWDADMKRQNFAKLQRLKPFMPPFVGTPEELESLVQYVTWLEANRPGEWPDPAAEKAEYAARLARIRAWLDEAGPHPAFRRTPEGSR